MSRRAAIFALLLAGCAAPPRDADAVARAVYLAAGGDRLDQVAELEFHFVVWDGETKKLDAHHRWDLRAGRDRVTWTDKEGVARDAIVDLATRGASGTIAGAPAADEAAKASLGEKAYARWVNDSYWLILPLKLFDPGVKRTLEAPREIDGKRLEVLKLEFAGVGLTPGDQYWLLIDPATSKIVRWEMVLQGQTPPPRATSFEDYRAIGPLHLALDHKNEDGKLRIAFEGVKAMPAVDPAHFDGM
jgi:hypothetical protein